MKKLYLATLLLLGSSTPHAQTLFTTTDSVDINNITASVLVHGDLWWQPQDYANRCRYPAHAATNVNYVSALWMSGYDAGNNLHMTAQTYREHGADWWPGPLDVADTLTWATSQNWAKIWKVNRTDIQLFQSLETHTIFNTPTAILTWPAKGNVDAAGNAGATLIINENMAPFVDVNSNGIYEPLLGDYPDVPGDQALWWVFSDNGAAHTESHGRPLGVEIHAMSYAYHRGTDIDNVIYYDYTIVNKSSRDYHNCRLAQWDDIDLGYWRDDFIGFDSTWRMAVAYNSVNDDGASGGHPPESFGVNPPQSGLTMVVLPGDAGSSYVPVGSFMPINNDASVIGNPTVDTEYNHYMRAHTRTGLSLDSVMKGSVAPCVVSNPNYAMPGNPADNTKWSECSCSNTAGDRRFVLSSPDFSLSASSSTHAVIALVVADAAKGCDAGTSFSAIGNMADTAWRVYHNPLPPLFSTGGLTTVFGGLKTYPNPARTRLFIDRPGWVVALSASITVYNMLGQAVKAPATETQSRYELDISSLAPGIYSILYRDGNGQTTSRFMKQ